jgi:membrane dipeptidase
VSGLADAQTNGNLAAAHGFQAWFTKSTARGVPGFDQQLAHAVIPEFNSIERIPTIQRALETGGFRASEIDKIMGGNWLRVFREVLPA